MYTFLYLCILRQVGAGPTFQIETIALTGPTSPSVNVITGYRDDTEKKF